MKRPFNKLRTLLAVLLVGAVGILIVRRAFDHFYESTVTRRVSIDFQGLIRAVEAYRESTGAYPTTKEGLEALVASPSPKPSNWRQIIKKIPIDAWGKLYRYRLVEHQGREVPEIYSCGKDGIPETEDDLSSLGD